MLSDWTEKFEYRQLPARPRSDSTSGDGETDTETDKKKAEELREKNVEKSAELRRRLGECHKYVHGSVLLS